MSAIYTKSPRHERRRFPRYPVRMACQIHFGERTLTAVLEDISLGGAGIRLPNVVTGYGKMPGLRFQLPQVGLFRSEVRWRQDRRAGLQFAPTAHRATGLNALISRLETEVEALPAPDWDQALNLEMTTVTSGFLPISS